MTRVEIFRKNGSIYGYRAIGHTGYDVIGSDIVCASLSTALQMTLSGLQEVASINPKFQIKDDGFMEVMISDKIFNSIDAIKKNEIRILLDSMYIFVKELSRQYPKFIKLVEKEEK